MTGILLQVPAIASFDVIPAVLITLHLLNTDATINALEKSSASAPQDINWTTTVRVWHMFQGSVKMESSSQVVASAKRKLSHTAEIIGAH